jgi:DNA-directed RNA polymerase subunit RPC12/RpoP
MRLNKYICPACGLTFWTEELLTIIRCPHYLCTSWKVQKPTIEFHELMKGLNAKAI